MSPFLLWNLAVALAVVFGTTQSLNARLSRRRVRHAILLAVAGFTLGHALAWIALRINESPWDSIITVSLAISSVMNAGTNALVMSRHQTRTGLALRAPATALSSITIAYFASDLQNTIDDGVWLLWPLFVLPISGAISGLWMLLLLIFVPLASKLRRFGRHLGRTWSQDGD